MVFLRLEVKVFSPEQAPSGPSLFRSLIGNNTERTREEVNVPKKCASFLLAVEKPAEVTLGDLGCLIQDEWRVLRPDQEPLAIKKLLDDANPSVDLNVGLTVEDVFVDRGKARTDGHDQRAVVRVIQIPTIHCPERFPSVVQDWDGAAQDYKRRKSKLEKKTIAEKFSPIQENPGLEDDVMQDSPVEPRQRDIPLPSVETREINADQRAPTSDAITGTPPRNGESEELGSPSPPEQTQRLQFQSRKRKQSPEEEAPVKNPRLNESNLSAEDSTNLPDEAVTELARITTPSSLRKRSRVPSFASPHHRRPIENPSNTPKHGLGLGITKSPSGSKTVLDMPSSEPSFGPPLFPRSAPVTSTPQDPDHRHIKPPRSLQSAMRKQTPLDKTHAHARRSVSFANGDNIGKESPGEALSTPLDSEPPKSSQATPSSSQIVYPPGFSQDKIDKIKAQIEQEAREIESVQDKLKDPNTDPRCLSPLKQLSELIPEIKSCEGKASESRKLRNLRKKLARLRKIIHDIENEEKESPPSTEPPLPPSASKVDRSIPITAHNTSFGLGTDPTWSFGSASRTEPQRRSSVASTEGTRETTGLENSHSQPATTTTTTTTTTEPPPMRSKVSPRKSPVKAGLEPKAAVVIHTPPLQGSKVASPQKQTRESPSKPPQSIEISSDDDEQSAEDESDSEEEDSDESEDDADKEDVDEVEAADKTVESGSRSGRGLMNGVGEAAEQVEEGNDDEEKADKTAKGPVQNFIHDEAEEQDEDDEEEDEEESEESSDEYESSDEDEDSDDSSDESASDKAEAKEGVDKEADQKSSHKDKEPAVVLPPRSTQLRDTAKSPAQASSRPPSSPRTPAFRTTLKGLLQSQKAEQAARQKQPQASGPQPQEKDDIYAVPSSSEAESGSDSDSDSSENNSDQGNMGDILPNGDASKMRRPYALRK